MAHEIKWKNQMVQLLTHPESLWKNQADPSFICTD